MQIFFVDVEKPECHFVCGNFLHLKRPTRAWNASNDLKRRKRLYRHFLCSGYIIILMHTAISRR